MVRKVKMPDPNYNDILAGIGAGFQSYDPNNMFRGAGAAISANTASRMARENRNTQRQWDLENIDINEKIAAERFARSEAAQINKEQRDEATAIRLKKEDIRLKEEADKRAMDMAIGSGYAGDVQRGDNAFNRSFFSGLGISPVGDSSPVDVENPVGPSNSVGLPGFFTKPPAPPVVHAPEGEQQSVRYYKIGKRLFEYDRMDKTMKEVYPKFSRLADRPDATWDEKLADRPDVQVSEWDEKSQKFVVTRKAKSK